MEGGDIDWRPIDHPSAVPVKAHDRSSRTFPGLEMLRGNSANSPANSSRAPGACMDISRRGWRTNLEESITVTCWPSVVRNVSSARSPMDAVGGAMEVAKMLVEEPASTETSMEAPPSKTAIATGLVDSGFRVASNPHVESESLIVTDICMSILPSLWISNSVSSLTIFSSGLSSEAAIGGSSFPSPSESVVVKSLLSSTSRDACMVSLGPSPSGEDIVQVTISTCPEEGKPKLAGGTRTETGIVIYSNLASSGNRTVSDKMESILVDHPLAEVHCTS